MDKQSIYIKFNNTRKPEFRLRTEMKRKGEDIFVYKIAGNKISIDFLQNIPRTYKTLEKLKLPIKINRATVVNNKTVEFDFIKGHTMLEKLEKAAKRNSYRECLLLYKDLERIIDIFPSENKALSENFTQLFGKGRNKSYSVIEPGVLDINLDNVLYDKNSIPNLIDYEWSFDFGIPKRYIFYRAIYYSYVQLGIVLENVIHIENIEKAFKFTESEIREYFKWEIRFQKYVNGIEIDLDEILIYKKSFSKNGKVNNTMVIEKQKFESNINIYERRIFEKEREIMNLENELNAFESFKKGTIWKILQKYRKLKSYFVK